jgi:DNA modification methylase/superfamily II DNA or RNA helicase
MDHRGRSAAAEQERQPMKYEEFIASKFSYQQSHGFDPDPITAPLFEFQRAITEWACRRGRAAIFADTGLGKTAMQLEWARQVCRKSGGDVLILAPLCVSAQTVREGKWMGIDVHYCRSQAATVRGVNITNYEMIEHFDLSSFAGIVLDESSILKSYMGKTKRAIIEACQSTPYRLACTATPSPNNHLEIGNHAEFLGIMPSNEMIMRYFTNDTMAAGLYRLKNHARGPFWEWVATWAMCISKPSDLGFDDGDYNLPELRVNWISVNVDDLPPAEGELFRMVELNATSIHKEGKLTAPRRAAEIGKIVNATDGPFLIWCNTNYEADELAEAIPDGVECRGSDSIDKKESTLTGFSSGEHRILITKPSIAGFGMNWQHCANMAFVGLSYSYEDYYQAIRRCWRFGQKREVNVYIACADSERAIINTIKAKEARHNEMKAEMISKIGLAHKERVLNDTAYWQMVSGNDWQLHHGDCVEVAKKIESNSIGFSVYSPPFSNLYIYSESAYDMGNASSDDEFMAHYAYLAKELHRITKPGRLTAIHCKDLPMYKGRDGSAGLRDFPGGIIRMYEDCGWQYHSRITIWKDPVIEMQRTKNHGLLYKQLCKDSAASRQGMADYVIVLRKWDNEDEWEPVTRGGERFFDYIGATTHGPTAKDMAYGRTDKERTRLYSIAVWQRYASPVWFDVAQTRVLNYQLAKEANDEKHICPLQLDVIERAIELWSNPGDVIFSPFTGIGSEGVVAVEMGRKFVGAELKEAYFNVARRNLEQAHLRQSEELDLFSVLD